MNQVARAAVEIGERERDMTYSLPFRATLAEYQQEAQQLYDALRAGDNGARWNFKWMHPRYKGKPVDDVDAATLGLADAQLVVAQEYAFNKWDDLVKFTDAVTRDGPILIFETGVDAVVGGDLVKLQSMLLEHRELPHARSTRRHRATLLHYIGANGVEGSRQKTPPNALDVMKTLLEAGAEPDAVADLYDGKCTTMSMVVTSTHPARAGLQAALAEMLLDYGASPQGRGNAWASPAMSALAFGYHETAAALASRGAAPDTLAAAAGLGLVDEARRLLPGASEKERHIAVALAAQHGQTDILEMLLDAGEDPNRYNPDGWHSHSTPLHQAIAADHENVARLLIERGARTDIKDTLYGGTPLGWADYCERTAIAAWLRARESESAPNG
ncbi:MAG TPA: ankyrin repeat domain-containing protein [Gemmatimonadaceae bacterium]|nr:ankyrin repeat domain-containing protein [Gemmatimonadaceae bacterium]